LAGGYKFLEAAAKIFAALFRWFERRLTKKEDRNILILIDKSEYLDEETVFILNHL
jgi:hypothetical protein